MKILAVIIFLVAAATLSYITYLVGKYMSISTLDSEPQKLKHGYRCPHCGSFWYLEGEEIHFRGCLAKEVRKAQGKILP